MEVKFRNNVVICYCPNILDATLFCKYNFILSIKINQRVLSCVIVQTYRKLIYVCLFIFRNKNFLIRDNVYR